MEDLNYQNAEKQFSMALEQLEQKKKNKFSRFTDDDNYLKSTLYLQLGKIYINKDSILFQQSKADQCYKNSLEALDSIKKDPSGWISLQKSKLYLETESPLYSLQNGIDCLKKSAEQGNSNAAYRLGKIYLDPNYVGYSLDLGLKYLQQSADKNFTPAIVKLGMLHSTKDSSLYDPEMAMKYFQTAFSNGYEDKNGYVLLRMGTLYADVNFSSFDMNMALAYIEDAAQRNNTYAMVKLAKCYLYGIGVEEDRGHAIEWLNKAAQLDNESAKDILQKLEKDADRQAFLQFRGYSYAILRQVFLNMQQLKAKNQLHLHELHFKTVSKQVKKEEYLHKN